MKKELTRKLALQELEDGFEEAKKILDDISKVQILFKNLEKSLEKYPKIAEKVSHIPILIQMAKSYVSGEYKEIPVKSIIAIISALVYVVSPIDLIPDVIPVIGVLDDMKVVSICIELVDKDIVTYKEWKENQ